MERWGGGRRRYRGERERENVPGDWRRPIVVPIWKTEMEHEGLYAAKPISRKRVQHEDTWVRNKRNCR